MRKIASRGRGWGRGLGRGCDGSRWSMARGCIDQQCGSPAPTNTLEDWLVGWGMGRCALKGFGMEFCGERTRGEKLLDSVETSAHTPSNRTLHCAGAGAGAGVDAGGWGKSTRSSSPQQQDTAAPGRRRCKRTTVALSTQALSTCKMRARPADGIPQLVAARMSDARASMGKGKPSLPDRTVWQRSEDDSKISRSPGPATHSRARESKWGNGEMGGPATHARDVGEMEKWCGWGSAVTIQGRWLSRPTGPFAPVVSEWALSLAPGNVDKGQK